MSTADDSTGEPAAIDAGGRVYVLDDDVLQLATMRRVLERHGLTVETFDSPRAFLRDAALTPPCCVVLDLQFPAASGLEVQEALAYRGGELAVVFVSAHGNVPASVQAMKAGAVDFLPKPYPTEALIGAVRAALERSRDRCTTAAARAEARERLARLSPREREVAVLLAAGLRNAEVGARLGTVEKTVKVHRSRLMKKLGLRSPAELVVLLSAAGEPTGGRP
jgi:FixJ family two-component response regulator